MKNQLLLLFSILLSTNLWSQDATTIAKAIDEDYAYLEDLYKHYHLNPELSFYEFNTSKRMATELEKVGFEVTTAFGGTGVVGILKNGAGPTILVRADMDALPIIEETGLPYASTVMTEDESGSTVGVMHACGHDIHMTVWTGAARQMAAMQDQWKGTLIFIGQPAEERSGGAKAMLKEGLFEKYAQPDYGLAIHVSSDMAAGKVGLCPGYAMANVDMVDITVHGIGGHGAAPHTTKDPVVLASRIVIALQTIVAREVNPLEPAVVTVGAIHGGSKGNVISNEVKLELTLRSYSDDVRNALIEKIKRIGNGVAMSAGLEESMYPEVVVRDEYTPSLFNDLALTKRMERVFGAAIGADNLEQVPPKMVGEDFGRFGRTEPAVPILQYWLGAVNPKTVEAAKASGSILPPLHSSKFAPLPEPTIKTGVLSMTAGLLDLLKNG